MLYGYYSRKGWLMPFKKILWQKLQRIEVKEEKEQSATAALDMVKEFGDQRDNIVIR